MTATFAVPYRLEFDDGQYVWLDGNQKISGWDPVANAFSIPEIANCPYRTPTCEKACYVHGLKKYSPDTYQRYAHNERVLRSMTIDERTWAYDHGSPKRFTLAVALARYIKRHCLDSGFRWHVSGDIFSARYEDWISDVVDMSYPAKHWIYTRSFPLLLKLPHKKNLKLNLSADRDNYWLARRTWEEIKGAPAKPQIAFMAVEDGYVPEDLPEGSVVFPDYSLRERAISPAAGRTGSQWYQSLTPTARAGVCPVDFHSVREDRRCGPCRKCLPT
jgi:hypothetical protein